MEFNVAQGSDEWYALRIGSIGASNIAEATSKGKGNSMSAGRRNIIARMVAERMTGTYADTSGGFKSLAMQRGTEMEAQARSAYEFIKDCKVRECGLFTHPTIEGTHASPDGVVVENGDDVGLIEIKCMMPANHLDVLMKREVPSQYRKQVQYQLECAEAEWSDFVCFNPSFPSGADLVVIRVHRDEDLIASLVDDIIQINAEVSEAIRSLRNEYNLEAV